MKIGIVGDLHLGKTVKGYDLTPDVVEAWDAAIDALAARDCDVLVIVGDVFDGSSPTPEVEALAIEMVRDAADRFVEGVVVLVGNHDLRHGEDRTDALDPLRAADLPGVEVATEPTAYRYGARASAPVLLALPYESRSRRDWETPEEYDAAIVAALEGSIGPVVVVGHLDVDGAVLSSEALSRGGGQPWPPGRGWIDRVVAAVDGHFHGPQSVRLGRWRIEIVGSLSRLDFGEATDAKRVLVVEV